MQRDDLLLKTVHEPRQALLFHSHLFQRATVPGKPLPQVYDDRQKRQQQETLDTFAPGE